MLLIETLQNTDLFSHPTAGFEVIETDSSWVLLTGSFAYKIKKPVNLGHLDYSTLEKRQQCCEQEVQLNRRLAAHIYVDVITIHGTTEKPTLGGEGDIIEYAIKMHQFSQSSLLDSLHDNSELKPVHFDKMASTIADFHNRIQTTPAQSSLGDFQHIGQVVRDYLDQIEGYIHIDEIQDTLTNLRSWCEYELVHLRKTFTQRKVDGFVRECHGDMQLSNMASVHGDIIIFDCVEYNPIYSHIDVINEIASIIVDLEEKQQHGFAQRLLNRYLEHTGDYKGLQLLKFYKVLRAMQYAKKTALKISQLQIGSSPYAQAFRDIIQYLQLAGSYTHNQATCLLINHGLTGSGKTHNSYRLIEKFNAIHLQSDTEENRASTQGNDTEINSQLRELTSIVLKAGYSVIVDDAHLQSQHRKLLTDLAESQQTPCLILHYRATNKILRDRIQKCHQKTNDSASDNMELLEKQINNYTPLSKQEVIRTLIINKEHPLDIDNIIFRINELCFH